MRVIDLATILVRMLAILIGLLGLRWLMQAVVWSDVRADIEQLTYLAPALACLGLAVLFWFLPLTIASIIVPTPLQGKPFGEIKASDLEQAAFGVIGIYILSWALPDLFHNIAVLWLDPYEAQSGDIIETRITLATTIVEFGIGVLLAFRVRGIYALVTKLRNYGAKQLASAGR